MDITNIITSCAKNNQKAQRELYNHYAKSLMGIAIRYVPDISAAQDVIQEVFLRVFRSMSKANISNEASLKPWMRRITVNESIRWLRKNKKYFHQSLEQVYDLKSEPENDSFNTSDILKVIQKLPLGYRLVFNMYVIEGYSHKEISTKLNIKESTSRSQLTRTKAILRKKIKNQDSYAKIR